MKNLPFPVLHRLSLAFGILNKYEEQGVSRISSSELGNHLGQSAHTIRKDINCCGVAGGAGTKYEIAALKKLIRDQLGFGITRNCCIVGFGKLGSAILDHLPGATDGTCRLVAGFDSNVNRLETVKASIPLFPAYRIEEIVRQMKIELAIITVAPEQAQEVADRCCDGGVVGLLNFAPVIIKPKSGDVFIRSMDIAGELRILAAQAFTNIKTDE